MLDKRNEFGFGEAKPRTGNGRRLFVFGVIPTVEAAWGEDLNNRPPEVVAAIKAAV
jgi:hypothetical protein